MGKIRFDWLRIDENLDLIGWEGPKNLLFWTFWKRPKKSILRHNSGKSREQTWPPCPTEATATRCQTEDVPGNEKADELAKEAAKSRGTRGNPFQHLPLESMRNNVIKQASKNQCRSTWKKRTRIKSPTSHHQQSSSQTYFGNLQHRHQPVSKCL